MRNDLIQSVRRTLYNLKECSLAAALFIAIFILFIFQPVNGIRLGFGEPLILKTRKDYSLWLVPEGEKREFYQKLIEDLGRKYEGPVFVPHITVIGNIRMTEEEVLSRTRKLARLLRPLAVTLKEVSTGDVFYRCVFAKAEKTQSLIDLYTHACQVFDIMPGDFMPHLSILYGDYDMSLKEKIAASIEIQDSLYLDSLFIYETSQDLKPQEWRFVEKIPII
jgi:2'-5' RNA ligase